MPHIHNIPHNLLVPRALDIELFDFQHVCSLKKKTFLCSPQTEATPLYYTVGKLPKRNNHEGEKKLTKLIQPLLSTDNLLTLLFTSAKQILKRTSQSDQTTSVACSFSHLILESFTRLTFCMLSRTSEVLMVPSANLNLSRLATDSSPAFGLMEGTGSPSKKVSVSLVGRAWFWFLAVS